MIRASQGYDFLKQNKHLGDNIILLALGGSYAYGTNKEGSDIEENKNLALEWFMKAANGGCVEAMLELAAWYLDKEKIPTPNYEKSIYWCDKALSQTNNDKFLL